MVMGTRHLLLGAGNFLARACSRTRPACDSAPGCPCVLPPRGRAAARDRNLPSSSVLPRHAVLREMGSGTGDPGSNTKRIGKKKVSSSNNNTKSRVSSHQINTKQLTEHLPSSVDIGVFLLGFHYRYLLFPLCRVPQPAEGGQGISLQLQGFGVLSYATVAGAQRNKKT